MNLRHAEFISASHQLDEYYAKLKQVQLDERNETNLGHAEFISASQMKCRFQLDNYKINW